MKIIKVSLFAGLIIGLLGQSISATDTVTVEESYVSPLGKRGVSPVTQDEICLAYINGLANRLRNNDGTVDLTLEALGCAQQYPHLVGKQPIILEKILAQHMEGFVQVCLKDKVYKNFISERMDQMNNKEALNKVDLLILDAHTKYLGSLKLVLLKKLFKNNSAKAHLIITRSYMMSNRSSAQSVNNNLISQHLRTSSLRGNQDAAFIEAINYLHGACGVKKNISKVREVIVENATKGHLESNLLIALSHLHRSKNQSPESKQKGLKQLKELADRNYVQALYHLGIWHAYHPMGNELDHEALAYTYFKRAHERGHFMSGVSLGLLYDKTILAFINPKRRASSFEYGEYDLLDVHKKVLIALQKELGFFCEGNPVEAREMFKQLAESNVPLAQYHYSRVLNHGIGGERNAKEAQTYLYKADEHGNAMARKVVTALSLATFSKNLFQFEEEKWRKFAESGRNKKRKKNSS